MAVAAKQVLLVEDDEAIREQLKELLSDEGLATHEAVNGRDAMLRLEAGLRPDLIILDLMMPVMDGWHVLAALRQDDELAQLPVIVATAGNDFQQLEGVHCVRKPFTIATILDAVQQHL